MDYSDEVIQDQLVKGLADQEILADLLGDEKADRTTMQIVEFIARKEQAKHERGTVSCESTTAVWNQAQMPANVELEPSTQCSYFSICSLDETLFCEEHESGNLLDCRIDLNSVSRYVNIYFPYILIILLPLRLPIIVFQRILVFIYGCAFPKPEMVVKFPTSTI